jgi:hypothetical protein
MPYWHYRKHTIIYLTKFYQGTKVYRFLDPRMVAKYPPGGASDGCFQCGVQRRSIPSLVTVQLLHHRASNRATTILTTQSDMILHMEVDASYLSQPKANSRDAKHCCLINKTILPPSNVFSGNTHIHRQTPKKILSPTAESELGALVCNGFDM